MYDFFAGWHNNFNFSPKISNFASLTGAKKYFYSDR